MLRLFSIPQLLFQNRIFLSVNNAKTAEPSDALQFYMTKWYNQNYANAPLVASIAV
jgi:hypothetical protein